MKFDFQKLETRSITRREKYSHVSWLTTVKDRQTDRRNGLSRIKKSDRQVSSRIVLLLFYFPWSVITHYHAHYELAMRHLTRWWRHLANGYDTIKILVVAFNQNAPLNVGYCFPTPTISRFENESSYHDHSSNTNTTALQCIIILTVSYAGNTACCYFPFIALATSGECNSSRCTVYVWTPITVRRNTDRWNETRSRLMKPTPLAWQSSAWLSSVCWVT